MLKIPQWTDFNEIWHRESFHRHYYMFQIFYWSLNGSQICKGLNFAILHSLSLPCHHWHSLCYCAHMCISLMTALTSQMSSKTITTWWNCSSLQHIWPHPVRTRSWLNLSRQQ